MYFYEFILFLGLQSLFANVRTNPPRNELQDFVPSSSSASTISTSSDLSSSGPQHASMHELHHASSSYTRSALDLHYHFFGGGKNLVRRPRTRVVRANSHVSDECSGSEAQATARDKLTGSNTARNANSGNVVVGGGRKRNDANVAPPQEKTEADSSESSQDSEEKQGADAKEQKPVRRNSEGDSASLSSPSQLRNSSIEVALEKDEKTGKRCVACYFDTFVPIIYLSDSKEFCHEIEHHFAKV